MTIFTYSRYLNAAKNYSQFLISKSLKALLLLMLLTSIGFSNTFAKMPEVPAPCSPGTLTAPALTSGCGTWNPVTIVSASDGTAGGGTYQWQSSTDNLTYTDLGISPVSNNKNYNPDNIAVTTWFRRSYTVSSLTCYSDPIKLTVNTNPTVGSISGGNNVCEGGTNTLTCTPSSGVWSSDDILIASINSSTGVVTGIAPGTLTTGIHYVYTDVNGCSDKANKTVTVNPKHTITGPVSSGASNQTACKFSPITDIVYTIGGGATGATVTGLPTGVTGSLSGTTFTISGTPNFPTPNSGTFNYTVTTTGNNCTTATATGTIEVKRAPDGTIPSAGNTIICAGQPASLNIDLSGNANFTGIITIALQSGTGASSTLPFTATVNGPSSVNIPAASLPNTSAANTTYKLTLTSLTAANGCSAPAASLSGFLSVKVNPLPTMKATGPTSSALSMICPGTSMSFNTEELNGVSNPALGKYNWVAKDALGVSLGSGSNVINGSNSLTTSLSLACPTSHKNPITFSFTPVGPDCDGVLVTVDVWVGDDTKPVITGVIADKSVEGCKATDAPAAVTTITALGALGLTFSDNCTASTALTVTSSDASTGTCPIVVTRTYTVTDACGNSSAITEKINILDTVAPTGTAPSAIANINSCKPSQTDANTTFDATYAKAGYTDNCLGALSASLVSAVISTSSTDCSWTVTYNYTVSDACNNSTTGSYTRSGGDKTAPSLGNVPTQTINVGDAVNCTKLMPDFRELVTNSDNCSGTVTLTQLAPNTIGSSIIGFAGNRTIVIQATDACGNTSTKSFTLNIVDTTPPVAICKSKTVYLSAAGTASITAADVNNASYDNCYTEAMPTVGLSINTSTFDCSKVGANTVILTVTDAAGNTATCSAIVTVVDNIAPSITCPANKTVSTDAGKCTANVSGLTATFSDNCSGPILSYVLTGATVSDGIKAGHATEIDYNKGVTTVAYTVEDASHNTATCSFKVTVNDTQKPTFTEAPLAPISKNADAGVCTYASSQLLKPMVTDNCSGVGIPVASPVTLVLGANTVTWTITDASGNSATTTQMVTVVDTQAPSIGTNSAISVNTDMGVCTYATSQLTAPMASDNCTSVTVTFAPTSLVKGSNTVTWTATDGAGLTATSVQTVTVLDNQKPIITTCATSETVAKGLNCTNTLADYTSQIVATDNCAVVSIVQTPTPGTTIVAASVAFVDLTFTVTDAAGNTAVCTSKITFTDQTKPVITCPANVTVNTGTSNPNCSVVATWTAPTITDNCSPILGAVTVTKSHSSGDVFPIGTTKVTYTATDMAGNSSSCSFTVTVVDNTAPTITGCPTTVTVNTGVGNTTCAATATWTAPTPHDNCSGVTIAAMAVKSGSSTAVAVAPGDMFPVGTSTVTYIATDAVGNTSSACSFSVIVTDNTIPIIAGCPSDIVLTTGVGNALCSKPSTWTAPTATDNCSMGADLTFVSSHNSGDAFPVGETTVTYIATDKAGNTSICTFKVTVSDNTAPVIAGCPIDIVVTTGIENSLCSKSVTWTVPTATDNCSTGSDLTFTSSHNSGATFPVGETTVSYTATDKAGNTSTCTFKVTVTDNTVPVIAGCPENIVLTTGIGNTLCSKPATWTAPTVTDNCSSGSDLTFTSSHNSGAAFPVGETTVTYTATDKAGNSSTCTFNVTVTDDTKPTIIAPAAISFAANNAGCSAINVNLGTPPTGADNCSVTSVVATLGGNPVTASTVFALGANTVVWTVTDASSNTASTSQIVTIITDLAANAMLADQTVGQNIMTTSTVTFGATGGTKPYTFTYTATGVVGTQTISTTGMSGIVTVPQSNAVVGAFTYVVLSVTDANGCTGVVPTSPNNDQVINVVAGNVDLVPTMPKPTAVSFIATPAQTKEGYVQVTNFGTTPTVGSVTFRISIPANFTLVIPPTMATSTGVAVNNSTWTITAGPVFYTVTSAGPIANGANVKIGYTLTAAAGAGSIGNMATTVLNGTGGDINAANNKVVRTFTIN